MFYELNYIRVWLVIGKRGWDQSISYYFEIFFIFELLDAT